MNKQPASTVVIKIVLALVCLGVAGAAGAYWQARYHAAPRQSATAPFVASTSSVSPLLLAAPLKPSGDPSASVAASGVVLDPTKNYGDTYKNGILPVGDNKYVTTGPKQGYIYLCQANFVPAGQAGAQVRGPWFINNNTEWDSTKKVSVQGQVNWKPSIAMQITGGKRVITTNDLPNHPTGIFPVQSSDPAYAYDRNPNAIQNQSLSYSLNANPTVGQPNCMGGEVGVMLTGVALFNGFDAGGRDAGAWEIQDGCSGHPQSSGEYHYHTLSKCIKDVGVSTVIGFALDGFPITGPKVGEGNILTTADLDECHGITSTISLDGKTVTAYHYIMTQDFPYSVSCFRSSAIAPPGVHENTNGSMPQTQVGSGPGAPTPSLLPPPNHLPPPGR